jgi:hypothetical protein
MGSFWLPIESYFNCNTFYYLTLRSGANNGTKITDINKIISNAMIMTFNFNGL